MNNKFTDFPQYRMLSNGKTYYKITSERHFEEIQRSGTKLFRYSTEAVQYPEILKIKDMLELSDDSYIAISEAEWLSIQ